MNDQHPDDPDSDNDCPFCDGEGYVGAWVNEAWGLKECPMCFGAGVPPENCTCLIDEAGYHVRPQCPCHGTAQG